MLSNANAKQCYSMHKHSHTYSQVNCLACKVGKLWLKVGRRRKRHRKTGGSGAKKKEKKVEILAPKAAPPLARPAAKNCIYLIGVGDLTFDVASSSSSIEFLPSDWFSFDSA